MCTLRISFHFVKILKTSFSNQTSALASKICTVLTSIGELKNS